MRIVVGIVQAMAQFNVNKLPGLHDLPGPNSVAILVVLVGVLLVRPTGILGKEA